MSRLLLRQLPKTALFRALPVQGAARTYTSASQPAQFTWEDPLGSKNLLTEEELAVSETAERYSQEHLLPRVLREWRT
jgi:glutaryl-CoA dehydrogenase